MFYRFGHFIVRNWPMWFAGWVVAVVVSGVFAPDRDSVITTGEFSFMPESSPSRQAERLYAKAFPDEANASTVAVIVRRAESGQKLSDSDLEFVDDGNDAEENADAKPELRERLLKIARESGLIAADAEDDSRSVVRTYRDRTIGQFLASEDGRATLAVLELDREFMDAANSEIVRRVERLVFADEEFQKSIPPGVELFVSGTAVVGRDMLKAAKDSAKKTELYTVVLVITLLILIYRAPLLALVPLITVAVAVKLTINLLCILAQHGWVVLFSGFESYVTVLLYGAGVDYCLFLIARYKEEADQGIPVRQALIDAQGYVGAAIAASAGTVICGIGMMIFAEFGKFHEAGIAITFGLVIVLAACLSFTPALLSLFGRWVFWPKMTAESATKKQFVESDVIEGGWLQNLWEHVGAWIVRRPLGIWVASIVLMLPFAVVGAWFYTDLSYGLLSDLPKTSTSVVGTRIVTEHFPAGATGPITVLLKSPKLDFSDENDEEAGIPVIQELTTSLQGLKDELQLADIRSVSHPLGGDQDLDSAGNAARRRVMMDRAVGHYVGADEENGVHVTRLVLTSHVDPFARDSMNHLTRLESEIRQRLPEAVRASTNILTLGPTASIRDLKSVTDRDQIRIDLLVIGGVFAILVVLLRQPAICAYLIVTVLFSYLATLGVTYLSFWYWDGADFAGLDWKVPMFLFTILIAVGEDYNIFLMTRIEEEQRRFGPVKGVIHALSRTGRIISSCGIIMAGTFLSLTAGSLKGMSQLGFALAFGVLLDTFVVRPILVPAYLVLLNNGRWGRVGRWLGGMPAQGTEPAAVVSEDLNTTAPSDADLHEPVDSLSSTGR
ncbi:MAG TPA: MMPL family transporter [Planctomycetaceae bacterium]|nr:MMPL family transporter [Planctomycetaceae bacterium]